jgi:hypothetical protein
MTGEELAAEMVAQLTLLNQHFDAQIRAMSELAAQMDTLSAHFDVVHLAMDFAKGLEGKIKPTIVDFAKCWVEAADEILPEEEEEDDGRGDVEVPIR